MLLLRESGASQVFSGPFFNEFVVRVPNLEQLIARCASERILPGIPLGNWYSDLADCLLVCVTEMIEQEETERLVRIAREQAS